MLEKNPAKRAEMLKETPLVPPQTKWFAGLNRETEQISNQVPKLDEIGRDPRVFPDLNEYKEINVTLDVILDNGQSVGPHATEFGNEMSAMVVEYLKRIQKGHNDENYSQ